MRTEFFQTVLLLPAFTADLVPISSNSKVVLRCEDTTSSGDSQAITTCQWGCYRRCLGGLTAQSDAGVRTIDIMITGDDLDTCVRDLPNHCRLHGSVFSLSILSNYCADVVSVVHNGTEEDSTMVPSTTQLMYKISVPQVYSDINLYATTFAPTDTTIGLAGRVPTDVCLTNSGFKVSAVANQSYESCNVLTEEDQEKAIVEQAFTFPFFSVNRLDVPLDTVASTLMNNQRGLLATQNHLKITTATNCYVQKPEVVYLFTKGNFTMTTGVAPAVTAAMAATLFWSVLLV